ncbi:MAG TPA: hypothetical protein PLL94_05810 [Bacteroidales bacterium]|jgi:hypothetical protein|nr:hypothetical protein [Bacteroidales bacterium]HOU01483.1 hypothetical protein [Bacteroidales bacterium]HQK67644.1 hypothetical protein [Bacteroidales bacterium]
MKKLIFKSFVLMLILAVFMSCTSTSTSKLISIEDHTFARSDQSGQMVIVDDPVVFKRGEDVHLILLNVGPFKKDEAGLNWFDLDMEVTGPDGAVLLSETSMLGDAGHMALEKNYAKSPYGSCTHTNDLQPGNYKFSLTIYDKIGNGKANQTAYFTLE